MQAGERIALFREQRGWKRPDLAAAMGTSTQQVERLEKGQRRLTEDWLRRAADALGVDPRMLLSDDPVPPLDAAPMPPRSAVNATAYRFEGASLDRVREDLPIYGTALGAEKTVEGVAIEQTYLNTGDIVGYLKRPVILNDKPDSYGLYVAGESMYPVFRDGEPIVAEMKRPARVGDDVVVYLRANGDDDDGATARAVLVKRLIKKTSTFIELQQFSPAITFRIEMCEVLRIDRVLDREDLLT